MHHQKAEIILERRGWLWKMLAVLWSVFFIPSGFFMFIDGLRTLSFGYVFGSVLLLFSCAFLIRLGWKTSIVMATAEHLIVDKIFIERKLKWQNIVAFEKGPTVRNVKRILVYTDTSQTPLNPAIEIASLYIKNTSDLLNQLYSLHEQYTGKKLKEKTVLKEKNDKVSSAFELVDRMVR